MEALQLFKKAGLEEYLKPLQEYAKPGLMGAGIGAAGMGLASMFGGEDDETGGQKMQRVLGNTLKGGLLGGAAGAGVHGIQKMTGWGMPHEDPMSRHHLGMSIANSATHGNLGTATAGGAALGLGVNAMKDRGATKQYDAIIKATESQVGNTEADRIKSVLGNRALSGNDSVKQRILERMAPKAPTALEMDGLAKAMSYRKGDQQGYQKGQGSGDRWSGEMDRLASGGAKVNGNWTTPHPGHIGQGIRNFWNNRVGGAMGGFAGKNLGRYAAHGLGGAAAGAATYGIANKATNAYMNTQYSPEQLAAWARMTHD